MKIKQIIEALNKFLINEMAYSNCCGLELGEKTTNGQIKQMDPLSKKIAFLSKYVNSTDKKRFKSIQNIQCLQI